MCLLPISPSQGAGGSGDVTAAGYLAFQGSCPWKFGFPAQQGFEPILDRCPAMGYLG